MGITFGADPDVEDKGWVEDAAPRKHFYGGRVYHLVSYFRFHRAVTLSHKFPEKDQAALAASVKRLINAGRSDQSIKRAMDRFYLTRTSTTHPHPALAFTNKSFQVLLFEGDEEEVTPVIPAAPATKAPATKAAKAAPVVDEGNDVSRFFTRGFNRDDSMDLPWGEESDSVFAEVFVTEPDMNAFVRTYPDVALAIVEGCQGDTKPTLALLDLAIDQFEWLLGVRKEEVDLSPLGKLPKDFASGSSTRTTLDTVADAVARYGR